MNALPSLHGSVGYIFTSCDLDIQNSRNARLKDMVERFKVYDQPRRPEAKDEVWLAGERVDVRGEYVITLTACFSWVLTNLTVRLFALRKVVHSHWQSRRALLY